MDKLVVCLLAFMLATGFAKEDRRCYAIVFSAGADKGAYQAGVVQGLVENLNSTDVAWEVVSGVAIGSINAALLSVFDIGDEMSMVQELEAAWLNASKLNIYKNWPGGVVEGLFFKTGLYDSTPLRETYRAIYRGRELKRKLDIGTTNLFNGTLTNFEMSVSEEEFLDILMATTAMPVLFSPKNMIESTWYDGSATWSMDVGTAINRCAELVPLDKITVDVVISA